jgi:hypothetical protein
MSLLLPGMLEFPALRFKTDTSNSLNDEKTEDFSSLKSLYLNSTAKRINSQIIFEYVTQFTFFVVS